MIFVLAAQAQATLAEKQCRSVHWLEGEEEKIKWSICAQILSANRKITYGKFSEFIQGKKITYKVPMYIIVIFTHCLHTFLSINMYVHYLLIGNQNNH